MKLNFASVLTIFVATSLAAAQTVSIQCEYTPMTINNEQEYGCYLTIHNPDGFDNFLHISGEHTFGFSNADVTVLLREAGSTSLVPRIICSQFPNLKWIALSTLGISEVTATSFGGCPRALSIDLAENRLQSLAANSFAGNAQLTSLNLQNNQLETLPVGVFANSSRLEILYLNGNSLRSLPSGVFGGLSSLRLLNLQVNRLASLDGTTTFGTLPALERLYLYSNELTELTATSFGVFENLQYLDVSDNPITVIRSGAFRTMRNLEYLYINACHVSRLESDSFEGLERLLYLYLVENLIDELPAGVFRHFGNIFTLGLLENSLKTVRREHFGNLTLLSVLDLDNNNVNAIERSVIEDATALDTLRIVNNLCVSGYMSNFRETREENLERLARCFRNFEWTVETTTESNATFQFYPALEPGLQVRVQSNSTIQIALAATNTTAAPFIEISIGAANNTRSVIRVNQQTDVAVVPSPGIIQSGEWSGFRVTWANNVVLVFREGDPWPFLVHTMAEPFTVNFYGLRTPESRGAWSIQPV